jgi:DNA-binding MarR family transcriptional regulator
MNPLCNCLSLRQATRRVTQLYDQALAPVGLRATQFSLLLQTEALGPIALQPLAEVMVMDRATLGHNVRPLLGRGLVQLEVGRDRRSRELSITQAGRDLLAEARALWRQAQDAFETSEAFSIGWPLQSLCFPATNRRTANCNDTGTVAYRFSERFDPGPQFDLKGPCVARLAKHFNVGLGDVVGVESAIRPFVRVRMDERV